MIPFVVDDVIVSKRKGFNIEYSENPSGTEEWTAARRNGRANNRASKVALPVAKKGAEKIAVITDQDSTAAGYVHRVDQSR